MEDIHRFRVLNKLKSVYRTNSVEDRKESAAEHSWSALLLADYLLPKVEHELDKLKVYELLMYHDVVEILAGDTPLDPENEVDDQAERELRAAQTLRETLPPALQEKYWQRFAEFEAGQTPEARFAKAIDSLDAMIHELDYKEDWRGWSREFLVSKKEKYFLDFPELHREFHKVVDYLEEEGYFSI